MIGGLLTDVLVVAAVLAFAWGAAQLGGLATLGRLVEATIAFTVAALLRDPVGSVVGAIIGRSEAFNNLLGMIITGLVTWLVVHRVYRWWRARRLAERTGDTSEFATDEDDPLDSPTVARIAGAVLGVGWSLLFLALLVLQPADTIISRSAVDSRLGGALIEQEEGLRWLLDGFPRYTQSLPKGELGAVAGERDDLPLREPVEPTEAGAEADALLGEINALRSGVRARELAFNPDLAAVARRHALALARNQRLSTQSPNGSPLDARAIAALGESAGDFGEEVGVEVVWAHNSVTAMNGLLERTESQQQLREDRWTEVGIGVAEMGWFNGLIYVVLLVGPDEDAALAEDGADGAAAAIGDPEAFDEDDGILEPGESATCEFGSPGCDDPAGVVEDPASVDPCLGPDVDGDGAPDPIDPESALVDCDPNAAP